MCLYPLRCIRFVSLPVFIALSLSLVLSLCGAQNFANLFWFHSHDIMTIQHLGSHTKVAVLGPLGTYTHEVRALVYACSAYLIEYRPHIKSLVTG